LNFEETEQGVSGLGVCIRDPSGKPIAAYTTAIPTARFQKSMVGDHVKALHEAASMTEMGLLAGVAARG
jgi:DNA-binding IclR family transcriptional regulator